MINIGLVEDNRHLAEQEEKCIKAAWKFDEEMELFTYYSAEDFMREGREEFDILILDIELPGMTGIELAEWLRNRGKKTHIIFLTAHDGYALKSYQLEAAQYVLKTEMEQRLPGVLRQLGEMLIVTRVRYRVLGCDGDVIKISFDDILYFYKAGKYVQYTTQKEIYRERISLDSVFNEIGGFPFVKIERGFVINARHIVRLSGDRVRMDNGEELPVSRRMLPKVKKTINLHSGELQWR